jgi:hypothetical protein
MSHDLSESGARDALASVDHGRRQVAAEIAVPGWYWVGLATGWVGLGVLADYGPAWATVAATVVFGAAHASIAPRVISGRHGSSALSVRRDVVGHTVTAAVIAFLVAMTVTTVGLALWFQADGARQPATLAGVMVAALVIAGGPGLVAHMRRRIERPAGP